MASALRLGSSHVALREELAALLLACRHGIVNRVTIRVLGPLEVEVDGRAIPLRRLEARMLVTLACSPNRWIDHDTLSERIYFDADARDTTSWRNHLRTALGEVSQVLETQRGRGTRLNTAHATIQIRIDVEGFHELCRVAEESSASGEYERAVVGYRNANLLWRGETPYAEVADDMHMYALVASLREERRLAQQAWVRLSIDAGDFVGVLPELRAMAEVEPTNQTTIAQLMRASAAIGNPTMAGEYYDHLCRFLGNRGELPTADLVDLHGRILRDELRPEQPLGQVPDVDLTRFIGRTSEVEVAEQALRTSRLVTLVGPPGVGKSRLGRELARRRPTDGSLGVVQLESCSDGSDTALRHHIADALTLEHRSGSAFIDDLVSRLADRRTLLILDNCEHVIESLIVVLAGLFGRLETVQVLATSREPLAIPGEILVRVAPLPVEAEGEPGPATLLCRDRVLAAGGGNYDEADLVELCRLLDGLPLAIELAAATVATSGIAVAIERFRSEASLDPNPRPSDPRHRSLASAIGWSFERLGDDERAVLIAAATFSTLVDALDVSALTGYPPSDVNQTFALLVARSLLRPSSEPGAYTLFETVRRFARLEARRSGQVHRFQTKHAARVRELATTDKSLSKRVLVEAASALRWAMDAPVDDAIITIDSLSRELYRIDLPNRLAGWLQTVSQNDGRTGLIAAELSATTAFFQGNYADLHRRSAQTLERVRQLDEPRRVVRLQAITAFSFALSGDYARAAVHAAEAEHLAIQTSDAWSYAWAASIDAYQLRRSQRYDEAIERAFEALDRFEGLQYPQGKAFPFFTMAMAEYRGSGDASRCIDLLDVGIRHAIAGADRLFEGVGELFKGQVSAEVGDLGAAAHSLLRALECAQQSPQWTLIVSCLEYAAVLIGANGDEETALVLTGYSAMARWRNKLAMQSRAIPYLTPAAAQPLLALPGRPDPKYMSPDSLTVTLQLAKSTLTAAF